MERFESLEMGFWASTAFNIANLFFKPYSLALDEFSSAKDQTQQILRTSRKSSAQEIDAQDTPCPSR